MAGGSFSNAPVVDISDVSFRDRYFGDRKFYKMVMTVAIPIMIQNGITNFVNLLDNIMVGRIGTEQMSGVSIVNQVMMVYHLCIFGALAGAGIFTAQFFGQRDMEGVRATVRFKYWISIILTAIAVGIFVCMGPTLIGLYLKGNSNGGDVEATLHYGLTYMHMIMLEYPAFLLVQVYSSSLRECGETMVPMKAGLIAVFINLVFNYLLIYGKFGFPKMGVAGAALATAISHYIEAIIVIVFTHRESDRFEWIKGVYSTMKVPFNLVKELIKKGFPLLLNETLWSVGQAWLAQCYSISGLNVVAAMNIANTVNMVFGVCMIAMGTSVGIIVGQQLGAGKMKEAKLTDNRLIVFSVIFCSAAGLLMSFAAPLFPRVYNTSAEVKQLATEILWVYAAFMPVAAYYMATYFTLRCGGKTVITFLFDSVFMVCVNVPVAFYLSHYTGMPIITIIVIVSSIDFIKCFLGAYLLKKNVWMNNLTEIDM